MGGKSTTSTQTVSIPPEVMARYNAVNARAEDVAATPFQPYSGEFVAPLSPTQQTGIQNTSQYSQAAQPYYGAATGLTMAGAAPVNPQNLQIGRYMSPYTGYVAGSTEAALRQQQGQQLSQQQTDAIRAGAFGGDRAGIQRAALQGQQSLATAQALAPIYQQGYSQALGAAQQQQGVNLAAQQANRQAIQQTGQQLAGLGTGAQAAALQGAQAQIQAGGVEQQTRQALDTAQYQQFLQQRGYPFQVAQFLANIAMGTGALSGSTTTTEQPSGLFSDERLKHDAERVGYTDDGLPIYTYKYNGDNKTQMGVMAQDVEKKHPDAVGEARAADGHMYKTVDYEKLDAKERAYGGGLDVNSMGGAVMEPGAFARGGYLGGGLVGDTEMKSMMASMKQPLGMYQQAGLYGSTPYQTPYGPGLGIRGDAVPVPSLVTAGSLKAPPKGAVQEALGTYQTMKGLGEMGSGIYDLGERVAVGRPERKNDKGEIVQEKSSGFFGSEGKYDPKKGWFGSKDIPVEATGQAYPVDVVKASGGLVGRPQYSTQGGVPGSGGLPYQDATQGYDPLEEIVKQGQQQRPSLPKPGQLPKPPEPLKDAMQTGMQLYSAGKMGSAAIDKGKELIAKMGGEGGLTPIAPGSEITAMPVPRPAGLGAAPVDPNAPAAGAKAVESTQAAANPAGTYTLPGTTETVTPGLSSGAAAPTEAIAASTPEALGAAAAPVAETAAAAAPEALGAGLAGAGEAAAGLAGAGEAAAGLAAGAEAAGAAAGASELATLLAFLPFSDRRLKDNIKAVGKTFDGQNIYSYNIGNGPTQMGLMAQEVAKKHPDAVGKRNGYMTVDYHEATEDAAHRGHFYGGGLVSRQGHANGERVIADYSEEADLPALGAVETLSEYTPDPRLIQSESGGNWKAENKEIGSGGLKGHFGRSQFGQARLMDAIAAGAIPEGTTPEKFMASPALQMAAEKWHYGNLNDIIDSRGYTGIFGKEINGVPVTRQGLVNVGHLGGPKGLMNFVESGGRYDPQDANKKSLTDYLRLGYASESGGLGAAASKAIDKATSAASGLVPTKKNERGEETTDWKKILIPLATGIAGMAAAPTRNWGTALAMGLGAGAQSFQNIDTKQVEQELKGREVATGEKRASIEDATRRMQLLTQLRQLASGYAQRGESLPPYLKQQIDELSRSLTTSTGSPELAGAAKSGQTTLAGPAKKEEAAPPAEAKPAGEPVVKEGEVPTAPTVASPEPPMPTLSNDFLKKLNPDTNPAELRKRGREAEAFSQGAGKQMFDEAARVEKEMYERGHGLGPKGEIVDIPGWAEYKKAVASQPKIKEFFDAEDAAAQQRVASGQIFRNLDTIFETFKPGKFAEQKAEFQQAVRSLGYTFNGSDMMDADAVQKIAKETTNLVFSDVKGIGGQPRVIEFQQGSKANPEFSLSPEANRAIMADKKAAKAYADKYLNDAYDAYQKEGWRFDVNKFNRTWRESADKIRQEMYDDAYRNTTVRGDVPRDPQDGKVDVNKLKDKHLYIIEPGMGIPDVDRSGQPIKLRWNDKENQFERP